MDITHFAHRHNGPGTDQIQGMLDKIGVRSLDELIDKTIPADIRLKQELKNGEGIGEPEYLEHIRLISELNKRYKNFIGTGYYGTHLPAVIQRNILENPAWYTSYTPYQAEISQGRLEALLNFQTMVIELTGMEIANASLLDEGTAAAEAMIMLYNARSKELMAVSANRFFIDQNVFPQTIAILRTRAEALGIELVLGDAEKGISMDGLFGIFIQYPANDGKIVSHENLTNQAQASHVPVVVAADILSLAILIPPGAWGADVVVGSTQRFGVPMNYGGPHAAYFATRECYKRYIPGRIIGVTIDRENRTALRMALQTREQHIKRERATSNICTAQALLATMASMYAVYHGPAGIKAIALRIHKMAVTFRETISRYGYTELNGSFFDTVRIQLPKGVTQQHIESIALSSQVNLRYFENGTIGVSFDETHNMHDLNLLTGIFAKAISAPLNPVTVLSDRELIPEEMIRTQSYMNHQLYKRYRSETEMMRYIKTLERKDYSLVHGMIPLGSCTMKLNAAAEILPLSWGAFGNLHPFVPVDQAAGFHQIFTELADFLKEITGFSAVSFQPNSGAAGEYAGLLVIKKYHENRNEKQRNIVLIPASAHGTNPASAAMAGMKVVVVNCDDRGNIDLEDLEAKAEAHKHALAAFMVTYPSTHGVFESKIREMIRIIHDHGGLVYMDGANMNAQVGITSPASIGADVCHLNLHKTFAIPHGGGGPGAGPILVASHLADFLPAHPVIKTGGIQGSTVAAAPWGSAGILCISHAYCMMLGHEGLKAATQIAILNANYLAASLKDYYKVLYTGENGFVGHEMILDCREFKTRYDITETDIAKRLMDYGFHAPTLSFPVHGTLMIEPTESESLYELDRFARALIAIHHEITDIDIHGNKTDNLLKNAPHTQHVLAVNEWQHPYSRKEAVFPDEWTEQHKFWPSVSRVDDAYGDRNLVCTCASIDAYR